MRPPLVIARCEAVFFNYFAKPLPIPARGVSGKYPNREKEEKSRYAGKAS
jgi:hypothetical protein